MEQHQGGNHIHLPSEWSDLSVGLKDRLDQKEYFDILHRSPPVVHSEGGPELEYYAADDAGSRKCTPLEYIKTASSRNDNIYKWSFYLYTIAFVFLIALTPFYSELTQIIASLLDRIDPVETGGGNTRMIRIAIPLITIIFIGGVGLLIGQKIGLNFKEADRVWQSSLAHLLQQQPTEKFKGIRACLLSFRQFIKWRRSTGFFFGLVISIVPAVIIGTLGYSVWLGAVDAVESIFLIFEIVSLILVLFWFWRTVDRQTRYRDPTVQLCVMVAELHARFVNKTITGALR
ncbi:hypothetical protein [Hyphobacterium sp.]|jgi:hypothetical protein|uniref:hypothetical protein n=1 Tax=Hyphobacterium sp. TaxID=2004662 RepID=UPI003BAD5AF6